MMAVDHAQRVADSRRRQGLPATATADELAAVAAILGTERADRSGDAR